MGWCQDFGDIIFADVNGDGKIDALDRVRNTKSNIPRSVGGLFQVDNTKGLIFLFLYEVRQVQYNTLTLNLEKYGIYYKACMMNVDK